MLELDGWLECNELYLEILRLGLLVSMEEFRKVSDANVISVL